MFIDTHRSFLIDERSIASQARREIKMMAGEAGVKGTRLAETEIIVSEMISNLLKHATCQREILAKKIPLGIEIISIDGGPGMTDPVRMMEDGVSTTATLGSGLGAIQRLSDEFDIYSDKGWGTIMLSRCYAQRPEIPLRPQVHKLPKAVTVPKPGEIQCGDGWLYKKMGKIMRIIAIDGLGHGPEAQKATVTAQKAFLDDTGYLPPADTLIQAHEKLRRTRGVVASIADFDTAARTITYCGIGNINAKLISSGNPGKSLMSYNGILGMNRPGILHNRSIDIDNAQYLVMASDGLKNRLDSFKYNNISGHDNTIVAAAIYKDHVRRTDDAIIVAYMLN